MRPSTTRTRERAAWALVWVALAWCVACGDDGANEPADTASDVGVGADAGDDAQDAAQDTAGDAGVSIDRATLSNGVEVAIDAGVTLALGDRVLVALAPEGPVEGLTYTESPTGPAGIWDFRRRDEARTRFDLDRFASQLDDGRVEVGWLASGGDGAGRAVVTLGPGPQADSTRVSVRAEGAAYDAVELAFDCDAATSFFGFGEQYNALDQRGEAFELFVSEQGIGREEGGIRLLSGDAHTTYFPMPWWLDLPRGVGVLVDTPQRVLVDLCAADPQRARFQVTGGTEAEFVVFHGPGPLDVITQLSAFVGRPKRPPAWAFDAPWISAQGGTEAVRSVIAQLDEAQVPYGAIWSQDWTGVRVNLDGGLGVEYRWTADAEHYPGLPALADELHAAGKRFLGYANPFIDPRLPDHFQRMADEGWLIRDASGDPYVFPAPNNQSSHPDLTQPEARAYVQGQLEAMVRDVGFDGWMADFAEWEPVDAVHAEDIDPIAAHNLFPVWWHEVNRAALDAARPDGDWVTIARSGWTGVQAHSTIHWVGDQEATWSHDDGLPTVVPAMLNLGLAGVPYVTHDIAGFSGGPSTKELFLRWTELGAFSPIMRTHEGNRRQENHNWNSDAETVAHFRRFARIHVALMPEWLTLADEADATSAPILRPLALHYPDDPDARAISDQFLIGDALLVAPVVTEGAVTREVYLPEGRWFHVFTGEAFDGPTRVTVDAPIGSPPVFSKDQDRPDLRAIE